MPCSQQHFSAIALLLSCPQDRCGRLEVSPAVPQSQKSHQGHANAGAAQAEGQRPVISPQFGKTLSGTDNIVFDPPKARLTSSGNSHST